MNYRVFDINGIQVEEGHWMPGTKGPEVPTHGSISFQIGDKWLSVTTSEWITCTYDKDIKTHKD